MKNIVILLSLAGVLASAHASFDLVMVTDATTQMVNRYDGTTGVYLGNFGGGRLSLPVGIVSDPSTGLSYVASFGTNTIQVYEYSTGVLRNEFTTVFGPRGIVKDGSNLYVSSNAGIAKYSTSGALLGQFGSGTYYSISMGTDGFLYGYSSARIDRFSTSGVLTTSFSTATDTSSLPRWMGAGYGSELYILNSALNTLERYSQTAPMTLNGSLPISTVTTRPSGFALAHGPSAYIGGRIPTDLNHDQIVPYSLITGRSGTPFGVAQGLGDIYGMSVVAAPEPGSMAALGFGLAYFVGKRRKK